MKISEIFYSLQGEGARVGEPTIFIRLSGCSAKNACLKSGVMCDTEYESGRDYTREELHKKILELTAICSTITWTGGEPTDQLTEEDVQFFIDKGYYQTIETSGIKPVPKGIDFISLSPKVAEHILAKHFPTGVTELRYVRHKGQEIPVPSITAKHYFVSPHSDGFNINFENVKHCIDLCLRNPQWKVSIQMHKIYQIL